MQILYRKGKKLNENNNNNENYFKLSDMLIDDIDVQENYAKEPVFRKPLNLRQKRNLKIALLCALGAVLLAGVVLLAVFLLNGPAPYDNSGQFYFSSDLLSEAEGKQCYTTYGAIEFDIYNFEDKLRVSKEAIEDFDIKLECDGKNITSRADISVGERAMEADIRSTCRVSITLPERYHNKEIEVSVSSSPILKELKGKFKVIPKWSYEVKDYEGSVCTEVVIYANESVALEFSWNKEGNLIPDATNSYIRTAKEGEASCIIELAPGTTVTLPMFKTDIKAVYSENSEEFSLKETNKKAIAADTTEESEKEVEGNE